jgi:hypothetical protein
MLRNVPLIYGGERCERNFPKDFEIKLLDICLTPVLAGKLLAAGQWHWLVVSTHLSAGRFRQYQLAIRTMKCGLCEGKEVIDYYDLSISSSSDVPFT